MYWLKLFIFCLLFTPISILVANTATETCSDIINQNEVVNLYNVRDQDTIGWCYAYVASDLLSYQLETKISAISLHDSNQTIEDNIKNINTGHNAADSIKNYLKKNQGLCLEKDLPSSDFSFCYFHTYGEFLNYFYKSIRADNFQNEQCLADNLKTSFPGLDYNFIKKHLDTFGPNKLVEFLYENQCKNKISKDYKVTPNTEYGAPPKKRIELINKIDELLSNGKITGIEYNYAFGGSGGETKSFAHASLIVGRRMNKVTGNCEYLIRNTWGKTCLQDETPDINCHNNCNSEGLDCRPSGHFWASKNILRSAIYGLTFLP